jgi:hypothetical protein
MTASPSDRLLTKRVRRRPLTPAITTMVQIAGDLRQLIILPGKGGKEGRLEQLKGGHLRLIRPCIVTSITRVSLVLGASGESCMLSFPAFLCLTWRTMISYGTKGNWKKKITWSVVDDSDYVSFDISMLRIFGSNW